MSIFRQKVVLFVWGSTSFYILPVFYEMLRCYSEELQWGLLSQMPQFFLRDAMMIPFLSHDFVSTLSLSISVKSLISSPSPSCRRPIKKKLGVRSFSHSAFIKLRSYQTDDLSTTSSKSSRPKVEIRSLSAASTDEERKAMFHQRVLELRKKAQPQKRPHEKTNVHSVRACITFSAPLAMF